MPFNVVVVMLNPLAHPGAAVAPADSANVAVIILPGQHTGFYDLLTESGVAILTESGATIVVH